MATLEQLQSALVKADAAGNTDDARAFASEIRKMQGGSTAPESTGQKLAPNSWDRDTYLQAVQARKDAGPGVFEKGGAAQNLAGGLVHGAGSIGATVAWPFQKAADLIMGDREVDIAKKMVLGDMYKAPLSRNEELRQGMDSALQTIGANPDSLMYKGGKLASEIAGTAGAGGVIANGLSKVPVIAESAPALINAIRSGGFATGSKVAPGALPFLQNQGIRAVGGAITGGTSAAMVNPEDAGTGALVGGLLPGAVKVAGETGKLIGRAASGIAKNTLGMTTGAGAETISNAYRAGKEGGTSFLDNMRGNVPMTDVLDSAKDALSKMRVDRGNQYRSGMVDIAKDKSVINFAPIENAVDSLKTMGSYKGQVINKNAAGTVDEVSGLVNQWKSLDPAEFHTPEGLDALKKAIGDVRDATQFGTPGRKAADTAYNAVKAQIDLQAPTYAKVMKDYGQASEALTEIEKALSLGNKAAADTSMRKLQSLMRNNVNTNYGNRVNLAKTLEENGAEILPAVAGQAASSWMPRGLQGLAASGAGLASFSNPATLAALPFASPRLMGELSYGLGAMNRGIGNAAGKVGGTASQLLSRSPRGLLDMEQFAPLLSTAPVISFSQR